MSSYNREQLQEIARKLRRPAKLDREDFDDGATYVPPVGWQLVGVPDLFKIKVESEAGALFAKVYAPGSGDFAAATAKALEALGDLRLKTPVLPAVGEVERVVFFARGMVGEGMRMGEMYGEAEREEMARVVGNYGLHPLGPREQVEVIEVGGEKFAADVIDDSAYEILCYAKERKSDL